ncbi:MAG: hypothetical protein HQ582_05065 [Planctomycetes bacterium]|nr:hypothetical protein [Planctomycetota bacterium]
MNRAGENSGARLSGTLAAVCLALLLLYFAPLGLILLDEFVFGNWLYRATPDWLHDWAEIVYWPILVVLECLGVV